MSFGLPADVCTSVGEVIAVLKFSGQVRVECTIQYLNLIVWPGDAQNNSEHVDVQNCWARFALLCSSGCTTTISKGYQRDLEDLNLLLFTAIELRPVFNACASAAIPLSIMLSDKDENPKIRYRSASSRSPK